MDGRSKGAGTTQRHSGDGAGGARGTPPGNRRWALGERMLWWAWPRRSSHTQPGGSEKVMKNQSYTTNCSMKCSTSPHKPLKSDSVCVLEVYCNVRAHPSLCLYNSPDSTTRCRPRLPLSSPTATSCCPASHGRSGGGQQPPDAGSNDAGGAAAEAGAAAAGGLRTPVP